MSKILVTGGAGFIGSHLVDALIKNGHRVVVVDDLSCGSKKNVNKRAVFYKLDIRSQKLSDIFKKEKVQYVFHLAAQKNLQFSKIHPIEDADTNIIGSLNVIQSAVLNKVKKLLFFSSAAVYDVFDTPPNKENDALRPITPYGIGKRTIEDYLVNSGLNYIIVRPSNVYGPRQDGSGEGGVVAIFCERASRGKAAKIFNNGKQTRDFIYVQDVVDAVVTLMRKASNVSVNVSTQQQTSVNELCAIIYRLAACNKKPIYGFKVDEQSRSCLDNKKINRIIGWKPGVEIRDGLRETYQFFKTGNE
jgi:UDP-glucose 4-epimerase